MKQITDSMSMAITALDAMDNHSALIRKVAVRLLSEHAAGLPELIGVRMYAGYNGPRLALQPRTNDAAALWAQALGVTLTESFVGDRGGRRQRHMSGDVVVDGVQVHVGACEWVPSTAADASAVAA